MDQTKHPAAAATEQMQTFPTAILVAAARGELDLNAVAIDTLIGRGLDASGQWVGFEAAKAAGEAAKDQLGILIAALRAIADPNKLDASRSPLPDNLARLALSWLAARPEFENARAVLRLYDRRAS